MVSFKLYFFPKHYFTQVMNVMRYLRQKRWKHHYRTLFIMTFFLIGIFFLFSPINNEFDYSTVIYPSPSDANYTNFFIYLDKKSRLALKEDQISLSKQHKILDDGIREIDTRFLLIEYTRVFGSKKFCSKNSSEIFGDQCPYKNCFYSCDQSLAFQAQLLLFHKYDVTMDTVPPKDFIRKPSQIWLLWHDEPNFYHGIDLNVYRFNWTTSYVFDAEASIGAYGMTFIREKPWTIEEFDRYVSREFSSRIHQALWLVTNCGAKRRLKYFRELKDYFPIQVFGSCVLSNESSPSANALQLAHASIVMERAKNQSDLPTDCPRWSLCEEGQVKLNMFYLSFESQSCKDYISEKFWRALKFGLIPSRSS